MNPELIRKIDRYIGSGICLFLTFVCRLMGKNPFHTPHHEPVQKILIIKLIEQGATVLAYPAIHRAIRMVGKQNVFFCVFEENREILTILDMAPPENIFAIRKDHFPLFLWDIGKSLVRIRRLGIDATVDMEFFARASAIFSYLTGAKRRVGLHRFTSEAPYRGDLMTHRIPYNPYLHISQAYALLVESLTIEPYETPLLKIPLIALDGCSPKFSPTEELISAVEKMLSRGFGQKPAGPLILLNPNASDMLPLRKWPRRNFILLAEKILDGHADALLAVTGSPAEEAEGKRICRDINSSRVISLAGATSLSELITLYTLADVLVTNDSGPAHFASLTDICAIVLYGPETPVLFGTAGKRSHALSAKLACSPCVNALNHRFSPCTNNRCMQLITVKQVYEQVRSCLESRQTGIKQPPGIPRSVLF